MHAVQPLRVGVTGLGWAGQTHVQAYLKQANVQVVALADPDDQRLSEWGRAFGITQLHSDYRELLEREDIDAISVCTPNYLHAPVAIAALRAGKHVLCEKPLARSAAEAETIVRAATEARRIVQVAFNHRARGDVTTLKRYVEGGGLGRIYHVKASWLRRSGVPGGRWFTQKELAGGGPLIDLGVHVLDLALFLLNEPRVVSVSAATYGELGALRTSPTSPQASSTGTQFDVEDLATAFLRLTDGTTLLLEASWALHGRSDNDFGVLLYGTQGGAEIKVQNYSWGDTLRIYTDVAGVPAEIRPRTGEGEGHLAVIRHFVETIRSGEWSAHVGHEGLYRARIIDGCYASAQAGREIMLEES